MKTIKITKKKLKEVIASMTQEIIAEEESFEDDVKDELHHLTDEIKLVQGNLDDLIEYSKDSEIEEEKIKKLVKHWDSFKEAIEEIMEEEGLMEEEELMDEEEEIEETSRVKSKASLKALKKKNR